MPSRHGTAQTIAFREAIAQWQLSARTQVKRASSLPSSMFGACDPMLEARLVESVESMLAHLHQPGEELTTPNPDGHMRTELVSPGELAALPTLLQHDDPTPGLEDDVVAECIGILVDAVTTGTPETRTAAQQMLLHTFAVRADAAADASVTYLLPGLDAAQAVDGSDADAVADLCQRAAAALLLASMPTDEEIQDP